MPIDQGKHLHRQVATPAVANLLYRTSFSTVKVARERLSLCHRLQSMKGCRFSSAMLVNTASYNTSTSHCSMLLTAGSIFGDMCDCS